MIFSFSDTSLCGVRSLALSSQRLPLWGVLLLEAAVAGLFFVALLTLVLAENLPMAVLLLDYSDHAAFTYPFSIQNVMHVLFFLGLGELFVRWRVARFEMSFLDRGFLPEDEETVLQAQDLGSIRRRVAKDFDGEDGFLPSPTGELQPGSHQRFPAAGGGYGPQLSQEKVKGSSRERHQTSFPDRLISESKKCA